MSFLEEELLLEHKLLRESSEEIEKQYWIIKQQREQIQHVLQKNKQKLRDVCEHDWHKDPPSYQERTWSTCSKCENIK